MASEVVITTVNGTEVTVQANTVSTVAMLREHVAKQLGIPSHALKLFKESDTELLDSDPLQGPTGLAQGPRLTAVIVLTSSPCRPAMVHIQLGGCGNRVGSTFWQDITLEHGLDLNTGAGCQSSDAWKDQTKLQHIDVYYCEAQGGRYVPRALLMDLDPASLDEARLGPLSKLAREESYVAGSQGAFYNFANGFYTEGAELLDEAMNALRREVERCDNLSGFQMSHSMAGGTGSGFGSLLLTRIRDEYLANDMHLYSVMSAAQECRDPYSTVLGCRYFLDADYKTQCFVFENEVLRARHQKDIPTMLYEDLNDPIAIAMSNITCLRRFPFQGSSSNVFKDMGEAEDVLRLRLPAMTAVGISPCLASGKRQEDVPTVPCLAKNFFSPESMLCSANPLEGKHFNCACIFRGEMRLEEAQHEMASVQNNHYKCFTPEKHFQYYKDMPPHNGQDVLSVALCDIPTRGLTRSATFLSANNCMQDVLQCKLELFTSHFRRKAFLHRYMCAGMDEMEFSEAESLLNDLMSEYEGYGTGWGVAGENQGQCYCAHCDPFEEEEDDGEEEEAQ